MMPLKRKKMFVVGCTSFCLVIVVAVLVDVVIIKKIALIC